MWEILELTFCHESQFLARRRTLSLCLKNSVYISRHVPKTKTGCPRTFVNSVYGMPRWPSRDVNMGESRGSMLIIDWASVVTVCGVLCQEGAKKQRQSCDGINKSCSRVSYHCSDHYGLACWFMQGRG